MKVHLLVVLSAVGLAIGFSGRDVIGQSGADTVEAHVAKASSPW